MKDPDRVRRAHDAARSAHETAERPGQHHPSAPPAALNAETMPAIVETAIQVAIRQGQFDDLPGAGKPIPGIGDHHDPDWWIRRKIERENLTGLGPPALMLRVEDRELDAHLDDLRRESDVRAVLEDFNRRVIEARRQLLGGPPVVTKPRDVDAEVAAWHGRRTAAAAAAAAEVPTPAPRKRWFRKP
ncbi:DUF1992 domain-containing protein [Microbacterium sp. 13-71-7]|uniref:DnaJ family domain-containing protein n=1 Tax=Microbacterium sp. 13-71-7 TaxID=1970399 RepID=UPI000BD52976|nr:DUF1992 domain-containing protein [Microbacterium sp. 13-71-7]OZB81942.1 MAG: molecular chaperone DnaJ [Microbacterium sp. 13-71-7]